MLHSICQQILKTQQWPQDWKWSVFIPIPKKGNAKECSNYHSVALISQDSKVCSISFKRTFHAKMGSIKDSSGMDLTEAEDIKRWQEYTEERYKKDLHDLGNLTMV